MRCGRLQPGSGTPCILFEYVRLPLPVFPEHAVQLKLRRLLRGWKPGSSASSAQTARDQTTDMVSELQTIVWTCWFLSYFLCEISPVKCGVFWFKFYVFWTLFTIFGHVLFVPFTSSAQNDNLLFSDLSNIIYDRSYHF